MSQPRVYCPLVFSIYLTNIFRRACVVQDVAWMQKRSKPAERALRVNEFHIKTGIARDKSSVSFADSFSKGAFWRGRAGLQARVVIVLLDYPFVGDEVDEPVCGCSFMQIELFLFFLVTTRLRPVGKCRVFDLAQPLLEFLKLVKYSAALLLP